MFPWHSAYVEPFLGGGSVFLNKIPSSVEVVSDKNLSLINMWQQIKDCGNRDGNGFLNALHRVEYDERTFAESEANLLEPNPVTSAIAYLCRSRMSRGGTGRSFAWSKRLRGVLSDTGPIPGELNSWNTFVEFDIPWIIKRVANVSIRYADWRTILEEYADKPHTLFYLDPPYLQMTRTARKTYGEHEMQLCDHLDLIRYLVKCKATWFLSGYDNSMYRSILGEFRRYEWDMPNHSGQTKVKQRRVECLWTNHTTVHFKQLEMEI